MKRLGIYVLLAALACSPLLLSCKETGNVKYFRHLRLYKIHDLSFSYPVGPSDYKKINCYSVEYDEDKRVVKAVYLRDGKPSFDNFNGLNMTRISAL
jgi:hypothetical protein